MNKFKKLLIILMLGAAFIWLCYTLSILWGYVSLWGHLQIEFNILASQTILFIGKNIPTILAIVIAKSKWY
jgi:hypothetical protein